MIIRKSLLTSLCQREELYPSLAKRGEGRFSDQREVNYETLIIGRYIADFYCPKSKLVIEVDGGQHYSAEGTEKDLKREEYIGKEGITVLRFSDREVLGNIDVVLEKIWSGLS